MGEHEQLHVGDGEELFDRGVCRNAGSECLAASDIPIGHGHERDGVGPGECRKIAALCESTTANEAHPNRTGHAFLKDGPSADPAATDRASVSRPIHSE